MLNRTFAVLSKFSVKEFRVRAVCALIIISMLTVSTPAAPESTRAMAERAFQDARFALLSSQLAIDFPNSFTGFFVGKRNSALERTISYIRIFPGPMNMYEGQEAVFAAVAYDSANEPISGVAFEWTSTDTGRAENAKFLLNSTFTPRRPGTYTIRASARGHQAEVQTVVAELENPLPSDLSTIEVSSRTGIASRGGAETKETGDPKSAQTPSPIGEQPDESNLISIDDPGNTPGNPPGAPADGGASSGNFQVSAPVISLPGRGIDIALNLTYNSRVWNKSGNQVTYDANYDEPAPGWSLGFGKMQLMGASAGCMMFDADGTRHGYTGDLPETPSPHGINFTAHTIDGTFIDYGCTFNYGNYGSGWAKLPNGTSITYASIAPNEGQLHPTRITDAQGNYITITWRNAAGNALIETVTDTMGRVIIFNYDTLNRLISVEGPRYEVPFETTIRTLVRIHYKPLTLNYSFAAGTTPIVRQSTVQVIDAIYYPATNTGYWFGDADSYSSYGMITKVMEQRNMTWTPVPDAQGTVTKGDMTKQAEYNYPLTAANQAGRTNGIGLTDAPTYETLSESWDGADVASPAVTTYKIQMNTSPRVATVIQPNGAVSRQLSYKTPGQFTDGLVYADETYVPDPAGTHTLPNVPGNFRLVARSNVEWQQGHYLSPRPTLAQTFDENGHKLSTYYYYDFTIYGRFNQVLRSCDYDNADVKLRCAVAEYENDWSYTGVTDNNGQFLHGRHIFNLVKSTAIENPSGVVISRTRYEYDNYQSSPLVNTPGVIQHSQRSNPFTTELEDGACILWDPPLSEPSCSYEGQEVWVPTAGGYFESCNCLEHAQVSVYDPDTEKRGNVTKVTTYTNAQAQTGPIDETRVYDITGNMVKASTACCEETSFTYDLTTHYAYPVSQTRGAVDTQSPHRITTSAVYDNNTGLVKQATDANGRTSVTEYDPDTMRPAQSISSTGAFTAFSYDDDLMTVTEEVKEYGGALAGKSKKYLNGLGQVRKEESHGPTFIDIVEIKYNEFAQEWKQSRPYRSGDTLQWSEKFYDLQGRLTKIVEPNGSETKAFYNEATLPDSVTAQPGNRIRVVDAWGRERWGRYDQQGRLIQVVEPNPNAATDPTGSVTSAGSLLTKYKYDIMGRLVETEQGSQFRKFKYDDLGRLTRQKLAEQTATLNDAGTFIGAGQAGANWSEAFTYDSRLNLTEKMDARGVRTKFTYEFSGGGDDPLNRIQERTYELTAPSNPAFPIHAAPKVTYEYMTSGDKTRIKKITTAGMLYEDYSYDVEGRVSIYEQKIVGREDKPLTTSYLYDTLDRVKEVTYPEQWGLAGNPRKIVAHTYDTASRLTQLTYDTDVQASGIVYNASDQTTEMKVGPNGDEQVKEEYTFDPQTGLLTDQKATKGVATPTPTTLLHLSYDYNRNNSVGTGTGKTGHLTKIVDNLNNNKNREYEFDALGRLTKAKGGPTGNLSSQAYTYDRYGNRTSVTAAGVAADNSTMPSDGIPNLAYDNTSNRITTAGFEYDVAGNQTRALAADGVTWRRYEYDAANRLHIVKEDNGTTFVQAFQFGSTNARLMDTDYQTGFTRMFASVGGTVLAEYHENWQTPLSWIKSYVYLGGSQLSTIQRDGAGGEYTEYNHLDRLGTRLITNQTLGSSYEQAHLPFGTALAAETTGSTNKRFTTYDRSAPTGLDYAVNRTYDSKQGRFTQVDPIGMQAVSLAAPQTLNMYTYCGNDPINYTDPSGLFFGFFKKLFKWIAKALKWIAVVVTIAVVVLSAIYAPGSTGFIAKLASGLLKFLTNVAGILKFASGGLIVATEAIAAAEIGFLGILAAGSVGAIANSFASKRNTRANQDSCDHWLRAYYERVKPFFDKLWEKTQNSKSAKAPEGLEAGGIIYISSSHVSSSGVEEIGWDIYEGPVEDRGWGMGDEFDEWQLEKKRTLGLSRPGDWAFLVVHTHPNNKAGPSGPGDKSKAIYSPEATMSATEIIVYTSKKNLCTVKR